MELQAHEDIVLFYSYIRFVFFLDRLRYVNVTLVRSLLFCQNGAARAWTLISQSGARRMKTLLFLLNALRSHYFM